MKLGSVPPYKMSIGYGEFIEILRQWKAWVERDTSRSFDAAKFFDRQGKVEELMVLASSILGGSSSEDGFAPNESSKSSTLFPPAK